MNINELRNNITNLINLANEREIPLYQIQTVFRDSVGESARNFIGLKSRLNGIYNEDSLKLLNKNLDNIIQSHIQFDDKLISLILTDNIDDFESKLSDYFNNKPQSNNYDYYTYQTQKLSEHQKLYQFSTTREINVRETISIENLREDFADDYQELIGIKKTKLNCYDFVLLDFNKNLIIIGIDLAEILGANEVNISHINFLNYLKKSLNINIHQNQKVDLFPKIKDFYNLPKNDTNGVIEIYFMTDEGTAHHETARGNTKDLRTATYHSSGVQGLRRIQSLNEMLNADISAYRITSKFYRNDNSELQIALKSSYLAINTSNGSHLYESYIYGARNLEQFNFIIDKLLNK